MSHELREGTLVKGITYPNDSYFTTDPKIIKSMTISEQPGQMGMVPWVRIERHDGSVGLANCALLEFVDLEEHP